MSTAKKLLLKMGAGSSLVAVSATSFAADYTAEIGAAATEANANLTAVILGVVALAALGFGVGRLLGWFK